MIGLTVHAHNDTDGMVRLEIVIPSNYDKSKIDPLASEIVKPLDELCRMAGGNGASVTVSHPLAWHD